MSSIAAFCVSEKVSGGELYLLRLLAALSKRGWRTSLIGGPHADLEAAARSVGIDYVTGRLGPKLGRSTAMSTVKSFSRQRIELLRLVQEAGADVVLLQYKLEQLLAAGRLPDTTTIVLEHGPIPGPLLRVPFLRHRYVRTLTQADHCFAASGPARDAMQALGRPSVFLPAGVDLSSPTLKPPGTKVGLFAGRLEPNKGVLPAIELVLRSEGFNLIIAGTGTLTPQVQGLVKRHPERLQYVGVANDVDQLVQASDFGLLLTSDPGEGRPLFALECAARGRPVIGLETSPAIRALADELAPGTIHLLDDATVASGALRSVWIRPVPAYEGTWTETATEFERTIGPL